MTARPEHEIGSMGMGRHRSPLIDHEAVEEYEDPTRCHRPSDAGAIEMSDEIVSRFVDIFIVKLRRRRVPFRWIGKIFRLSPSVVHERIASLPDEIRRHYETLELG